jgi:hypothetical protein
MNFFASLNVTNESSFVFFCCHALSLAIACTSLDHSENGLNLLTMFSGPDSEIDVNSTSDKYVFTSEWQVVISEASSVLTRNSIALEPKRCPEVCQQLSLLFQHQLG